MIERVREAESYITSLGITQCRVRNHRGIVRIEIHEKDLACLMAASVSIVNAFIRLGFIYANARSSMGSDQAAWITRLKLATHHLSMSNVRENGGAIFLRAECKSVIQCSTNFIRPAQ